MTKTPSIAYVRQRVESEIKIVHQYRILQISNVVTGMINVRDKVMV